MLAYFLSVFASLFSVVDPLGAMPVFLSLTQGLERKEIINIALRTSLYFVIILLIFFFTGTYILSFFHISIDSMRIAGGIIIFISGYSLLRGDFAKSRSIDKKVKQEAREKEDISLTPLAIPLLAGPGSISLLIGLYFAAEEMYQFIIIPATIVALGITTFIILIVSPRLFRIIGVAGLNSISRIIGFLVMCIGIQYVISGVGGVLSGWGLVNIPSLY